jgi:hypothetical protein
MSVSQYYGIPRNICSVQANTLEHSKYKIKTALGESTTTYQHSSETPIFGTGQCSSASPSIWLMKSSFLMDIYETMAQGMTMINVNNNKTTKKLLEHSSTMLHSSLIQSIKNKMSQHFNNSSNRMHKSCQAY